METDYIRILGYDVYTSLRFELVKLVLSHQNGGKVMLNSMIGTYDWVDVTLY
jgi:hypothetical protein